MKHTKFMTVRLALAVAFAAVFAGCATRSIRVGTYNVRMQYGDADTPNAWTERREDLVGLVRKMDLDVFGMQEVCPDQARYFREKLGDWEFVGDHREADRISGEASPVFYRKSRFEALKAGTFWLSETPDVPASKSWGTACTRVCSYLILRDRRTGRRFCFANTHTDHVSEEAREKGMLLIIERMKKFGEGASVVFVGDHNCSETEAPAVSMSKILRNAMYVTETPPTGSWRSWNGWRWRDEEVSVGEALSMTVEARNDMKGSPDSRADGRTDRQDAVSFYDRCGGSRLDYIYVSPDVRVKDYRTVTTPRRGKKLYPSDHFPVTATVEL